MERTQIYLTRDQRLRLGALARRRGAPMAVLVREAVERYLASGAPPAAKDSLFDLVGAAGSLESATDVSTNHHRYLRHAHWDRPRR